MGGTLYTILMGGGMVGGTLCATLMGEGNGGRDTVYNTDGKGKWWEGHCIQH